jgi:hypothetical protein
LRTVRGYFQGCNLLPHPPRYRLPQIPYRHSSSAGACSRTERRAKSRCEAKQAWLGPWDKTTLAEARLGTLEHRLCLAALDSADWTPSAGILLSIATCVAIALTNSGLRHGFTTLWEQSASLTLGQVSFQMSLVKWINDGPADDFLLLVVGLEIKREFSVGRLLTAPAYIASPNICFSAGALGLRPRQRPPCEDGRRKPGALFIPTRPPANLTALKAQANAILTTAAAPSSKPLRHRTSLAGRRRWEELHRWPLKKPHQHRPVRSAVLLHNHVISDQNRLILEVTRH